MKRVQNVCISNSYCVTETARHKFSLVILFTHWGKISLLNVSCNCTCFTKLESWSFLILVFITWISGYFFHMVCIVSHDCSLLCFTVYVLLVFFKHYFENMMYFSIKNTIKINKKKAKRKFLTLSKTSSLLYSGLNEKGEGESLERRIIQSQWINII